MDELEEVVDGFLELRVGVVGDIMLDRYVKKIKSNRINPEDDAIPIFRATETLYTGAASYVARIASLLGARCDLYGVVGDDLYGRELERMCRQAGVNPIFQFDGLTIVKERHYDVKDNSESEKYRERIDYGEGQEKISKNIQDKIFSLLEKRIRDYSVLIFPDYNKRIFTEKFTHNLISLAKSAEVLVVVDPKPANIDFFRGCNVVCPNIKEAEEIVRTECGKSVLKEIGKKLQERVDSDYAVITCGGRGSYIYSREGKVKKMVLTNSEETVDVTGAGDAFSTTLSLSLGFLNSSHEFNLGIIDIVRLANAAAASVVGKKGTVNLSKDEIRKFLKRQKVLLKS